MMTTFTTRRRRRHDGSSWITPLAFQKRRSMHSSPEKSTNRSILTGGVFLCFIVPFCIFIGIAVVLIQWALPALSKENGSLLGRTLRNTKQSRISQPIHFKRTENNGKKHLSVEYVNFLDDPRQKESIQKYDVVIVGCGPAGLTAALFASRIGMSVLVIGSPSAGSLAGTDRLENFPSYLVPSSLNGGSGGGGQGWLDATMEQAFSFGAKFATPTFLATGLTRRKIDTNIANNNAGDDLSQYILEVDISSDDPNHVPQMSTSKSTKSKIQAKTVIIASGTNPRKLDLPHEKSLWGNSIHNCALCDGDAYAPSNLNNQHHPSNGNTQMHPKNGKLVVVIGGGDAAIEAISLLSRVGVETIHWIHRRNEFKASAIEVERVRQSPNVQIWTPYVVVEWIVKENGVVNGEDGNNPAPLILDGVRIVGSNNGIADPEATSSLTINCDGAFLMIGSTPNTRWLQDSGIEIDQTSGLIQHTPTISLGGVNSASFSTATSIPGVFAAGEAVDPIYRQALTASSDGAKAAMDAERYLRLNIGITPNVSLRTTFHGNKLAEDNPPNQKELEFPVDCDLTTVDCITSLVSSHPVVVFSKPYCPYCRRALEALGSLMGNESDPFVVDLTEIKDGSKVQGTLLTMTGRRTVPNVFIGGTSIGGGDETIALYRAGKLGAKLREAGAIH